NFAVVVVALAGSGALALSGDKAPLAAGARIHFPERHLEGVVGAPLHGLFAGDQGLEYTLGRGGDLNFADDGVVVRGDYGRHGSPSRDDAARQSRNQSQLRSKAKSKSKATDKSVRLTRSFSALTSRRNSSAFR